MFAYEVYLPTLELDETLVVAIRQFDLSPERGLSASGTWPKEEISDGV